MFSRLSNGNLSIINAVPTKAGSKPHLAHLGALLPVGNRPERYFPNCWDILTSEGKNSGCLSYSYSGLGPVDRANCSLLPDFQKMEVPIFYDRSKPPMATKGYAK